MADNENVNNWT